MFVKIKGLTKKYSHQPVFSSLDLEIAKGSIISLVGPSGCGKSTFLRCLAGLEEATSGSISLDGKDITGVSTEKRPVVMMFQQPLLFPHMNVLENVTYGLKHGKNRALKKERMTRGMAMLEKVELAELAKRYPSQLSGGQQQRVALARALIMNPSLLLLDEPFSSLDPTLRISLRQWVRNVLKEEGVTALFVTHDREEAMTMGDRIAIMSEGAFQQVGLPEEVCRQPASSVVAEMFAEGLKLETGFVPADQLVLSDDEATGTAGRRAYPARVENRIFKFGQPFYHIIVNQLNQEVMVHSKQEFDTGSNVYITFKNSDVQHFYVKKAHKHQEIKGSERNVRYKSTPSSSTGY
ncbi:ABC transporter ATP-binding protein [Bacillus marinisedimentorum]|uniref:ABC transporter ATP-binding protein n=1 Tax=Bacillus marinisedimentorum TaxID=1821260 RepID=UPI00087301E1|nr:ABC transporter ATP-binding protein [Bacillus marinisedimentorum]